MYYVSDERTSRDGVVTTTIHLKDYVTKLMVIDGRAEGMADGTSIYETAFICLWLGMKDAINLDGGGSSTLWTDKLGLINHPSDNKKFDHDGERSVPNLIIVK